MFMIRVLFVLSVVLVVDDEDEDHTVRQMLFINQTIPAKNQLEGLVVFHIFMSEGIIFGEQKLKEL